MNKLEIFQTLKDKGFSVEEQPDGVIVSLNRNLGFMEIKEALNFEIEGWQLERVTDNQVFILTIDEDEDIPDCFGVSHQYTDIGQEE